jgi:hypothetical protein
MTKKCIILYTIHLQNCINIFIFLTFCRTSNLVCFTLQVFYMWRQIMSTAPPFLLWWPNLEILFCPPPPQFLRHRRAALSNNSKGTQSVNTRKVVYNVRCMNMSSFKNLASTTLKSIITFVNWVWELRKYQWGKAWSIRYEMRNFRPHWQS